MADLDLEPGYMIFASPPGMLLLSFEPDDYNGGARWDPVIATIFRTIEDAIAVALQVSDHEGVADVVILDALTREKVDWSTWVPPPHPSKSSSKRRRLLDTTRSASRTTPKRSRS